MVGDERAGFQNVRSIREEDVWSAYIYGHAARNAIHGMCETWMTEQLAKERAEELLKSGYGRMYHVAGTARNTGTPERGCGCGLFVNSAIAQHDTEKVVYAK